MTAQTQETLVSPHMVCNLISVYLSCCLSRHTGHMYSMHPVHWHVLCMYHVCACKPCVLSHVHVFCVHVCMCVEKKIRGKVQ